MEPGTEATPQVEPVLIGNVVWRVVLSEGQEVLERHDVSVTPFWASRQRRDWIRPPRVIGWPVEPAQEPRDS